MGINDYEEASMIHIRRTEHASMEGLRRSCQHAKNAATSPLGIGSRTLV